jgi:hypothetical protein
MAAKLTTGTSVKVATMATRMSVTIVIKGKAIPYYRPGQALRVPVG